MGMIVANSEMFAIKHDISHESLGLHGQVKGFGARLVLTSNVALELRDPVTPNFVSSGEEQSAYPAIMEARISPAQRLQALRDRLDRALVEAQSLKDQVEEAERRLTQVVAQKNNFKNISAFALWNADRLLTLAEHTADATALDRDGKLICDGREIYTEQSVTYQEMVGVSRRQAALLNSAHKAAAMKVRVARQALHVFVKQELETAQRLFSVAEVDFTRESCSLNAVTNSQP